jgi:protein involved in polysaccharide export with SLBB domain
MLNRTIFFVAILLFAGIAFGQSYSVIGEVGRPGIYRLSPDSSVLTALQMVRGLTASADPHNVVVVRGQRLIRVDLDNLLRGRIEDIPLMDGDEVVIPNRAPSQPLGFRLVPITG